MVENSKKLGFSTNNKQVFTKYLLVYMWFYKGIKIAVALIYKINPVQITTIIEENTENSLNSVLNTIENIQFKRKNCEKFSPIVKVKLALFLKCHGHCCTNSVCHSHCCTNSINCSYAKHQKAAINCSHIYCEGKHNKVLQTCSFLSNTHSYVPWCYKCNWEHLTK